MKIKLTEEQYFKLFLKEEEEKVKEFNSCALSPWIGKDGNIIYYLNGCKTDDDIKIIDVDKIRFNITQRDDSSRAGQIIEPLSFELLPHGSKKIGDRIINLFIGEKNGFLYKENSKYKDQKVPSFTEEVLNDLLGEKKISKFLSGINGVSFRETYENLSSYNHNLDPTTGTEKGEERSKVIKQLSNQLYDNRERNKHPTLSSDQISRASRLFNDLRVLGYPLEKESKDNKDNDINKLLNNTQNSEQWGRNKKWFEKNKNAIDMSLKQLYSTGENYRDGDEENSKGIIHVGPNAEGSEEWSLLNFFNTNSKIREKLVYKYITDNKPNEFNIKEYTKWINDNKVDLFTDYDNNDFLKVLVDKNSRTWKKGTDRERSVMRLFKEKLDEDKWEVIWGNKPGLKKDMSSGIDIEVRNKSNGDTFGFQVKPHDGETASKGGSLYSRFLKRYNPKKVHFYVFSTGKYLKIIKNNSPEIKSEIKKRNGKDTKLDKFIYDINNDDVTKTIFDDMNNSGSILSEDTNHSRLIDKVYDEIKSKDIGDAFDIIVNVYGLSVDEVMRYDKLVSLIGNKVLDRKKQTGFLGFNPRPYVRYMSRIGTKLTDDVVNSNLPPKQKLFELYDILWFFNDSVGEEDTLDEMLTLIPKVLDFYFKTYPPKKAVQMASILKDNIRGRRFYSTITNITNDFAEQNNLKVFPKTAGLTFQKKDGMLQDLIDYITDKEKKTKEGFLKYINSRGRTPGQHSTFFRAAVASGVVKKVRDGRTITYELGPNYEAWKNGNLVAI